MAEATSTQKKAAKAPVSGEGRVQRIGARLIMRLPGEASLQLPSRGQVAVDAVLNDYAISTVLEPDGAKGHWLAVDEELREALGLEEGSAVEFELAPAGSWPEPEVPEDLRQALEQAPDLAGTWADITPMARWEWVRWVGATKSAQTRERRVEVSISKLRAGKRRPCCFDLSSCTDPELSKNGKLLGIA